MDNAIYLGDLKISDNFKMCFSNDSPDLSKKLIEVGLIPDKIFKVLFRLHNGTIIIGNESTKIAIDENSAHKIMVTLQS
ncbi:MAG: FeoA domain [Candidatus Midichloriaceae bacterium]|jgi:Fe2+ transport system protein FeoA|nr:FeoA domain [Candidatus Midichloriaceae bacterium]